MWDSFSLLGLFTETEAMALPLFSLSHTHKTERKRQPRTNHTAADDMLIHTRVMAYHQPPPSPQPPAYLHTHFHTQPGGLTRLHVRLSYYHEDGPFSPSTIHLN